MYNPGISGFESAIEFKENWTRPSLVVCRENEISKHSTQNAF